jgi:hypothetical protein
VKIGQEVQAARFANPDWMHAMPCRAMHPGPGGCGSTHSSLASSPLPPLSRRVTRSPSCSLSVLSTCREHTRHTRKAAAVAWHGQPLRTQHCCSARHVRQRLAVVGEQQQRDQQHKHQGQVMAYLQGVVAPLRCRHDIGQVGSGHLALYQYKSPSVDVASSARAGRPCSRQAGRQAGRQVSR